MKNLLCLCVAVIVLLPVGGFAERGNVLPPAPEQIVTLPNITFEAGTLSGENFTAADIVAAQMSGKVSRNSPVLIASMVQLNDFAHTSALGRLVMQQISSRLSQYGYKVLESRLKKDYSVVPNQGEFVLTREASDLMQKEYNAQVVLVGSYVPTPYRVYVSIRLLRIADGVVMAAHEYTLKNRREFAVLLREDKGEQRDLWAMYNKRPAAFAKPARKKKSEAVSTYVSPDFTDKKSGESIDMTNFPVLRAPANMSELER